MRGAILLLISMLIIGCATVINEDSTPDTPSTPLPPVSIDSQDNQEEISEAKGASGRLESDKMSIEILDTETKGMEFEKVFLRLTNMAGNDIVNLFCDFEFKYAGEIVESSKKNNVMGFEERFRNGQTIEREFKYIKKFSQTGEYDLNVICYPGFDETIRVSDRTKFDLKTLSDEIAIRDVVDALLKKETYCTYKCLTDFKTRDNNVIITIKIKTKALSTAQADEFNALSIVTNIYKSIWPEFSSVSEITVNTYVDFDNDGDGTKEDVLIQTATMERNSASKFEWKSLRVDMYTVKDIKDNLIGYSFFDSIYPIPRDYK